MTSISSAKAVQLHNVARQATVLILMLALPVLGVGQAEIGGFEAVRYIGMILTYFWVSALGTSYLRIRQTTIYHQRWFIFSMLCILLASLFAAAALLFGLEHIGSLLLNNSAIPFGLAYALYLTGSLLSSIVVQEAIGDQAGKRLLAFSFSYSFLQLALFLVPLALGYPLEVSVWGLASTSVYVLIWTSVRFVRKTDIKPPPRDEITTFGRSFWQLSTATGIYLFVAIVDHKLVTYVSGGALDKLAIWRYGVQEIPLLVGIVSGIGASALAEAQGSTSEMLSGVLRRSNKVNALFLPLAILLMSTSWWLFPTILGDDFYPSHVIFNTILLIVPVRLIISGPMLITNDLQGLMVKVAVGEVIVNIVVSVALFPYFGLLGIAIGTVVANWCERVSYTYVLHQHSVRLSQYINLKLWGLGTVLLFVIYALATDFSALN